MRKNSVPSGCVGLLCYIFALRPADCFFRCYYSFKFPNDIFLKMITVLQLVVLNQNHGGMFCSIFCCWTREGEKALQNIWFCKWSLCNSPLSCSIPYTAYWDNNPIKYEFYWLQSTIPFWHFLSWNLNFFVAKQLQLRCYEGYVWH